jgi:hypothetical protein
MVDGLHTNCRLTTAESKIKNQKAKGKNQEVEDGAGVGGPSLAAQSKIPNPKSKIKEQSPIDDRQKTILWRVEHLIGVFLCSEAYQAFNAAEECNHQVEEAFDALQGALDDALGRLEVGSEHSTLSSRQ